MPGLAGGSQEGVRIIPIRNQFKEMPELGSSSHRQKETKLHSQPSQEEFRVYIKQDDLIQPLYKDKYLQLFTRLDFNWSPKTSDSILSVSKDTASITNKKGYWSSALGDQPMSMGNRYFFKIKFVKGYDCFIGIATK